MTQVNVNDPMVGFSLWLDREQWGLVYDGLIALRASAFERKAHNSESTSDLRAAACAEVMQAISAKAEGRDG